VIRKALTPKELARLEQAIERAILLLLQQADEKKTLALASGGQSKARLDWQRDLSDVVVLQTLLGLYK
jgi:hypothetical protein